MPTELHGLVVGEKAPEFSLPNQDGDKVSLKSLKGKQVVLYFYPKDDTSGCTKEACDFRDSLAPIKKTGGGGAGREHGWQGLAPEVHCKVRTPVRAVKR